MIYSDEQIQLFINEKKELSTKLLPLSKLNSRNGHLVKDVSLVGFNNSHFMIKIRKSVQNPFDFSVILSLVDPQSNVQFRLLRYNGNSHPHLNRIEKYRFYFKFHIHMATERYQKIGSREDAFAEESDRFSSIESALRCLLQDCNIDDHSINNQMDIWEALPN